jgi:hypothetical protein
MRVNIIRKILVVLIIVAPVLSYSGCKKQAKCGCSGDVLFSLTGELATVYFSDTGANAQFSTLSDPYSIYYFCNPTEMLPKLSKYKTGDVLQVSGQAFWECNYLYQSSSSSYQTSMYKVYNIMVTDVTVNLFGKK